MIITIDGPSASGKSTIAFRLAQRLQIQYLCSGLLFRALAYCLMHDNGYTLATIAKPDKGHVDLALQRFLYYSDQQQGAVIKVAGVDITPLLKTATCASAASLVSTDRYVRDHLQQLQRDIVASWGNNAVVEGRDAGTVVFPQAAYKFFLTAVPEVRAQRWQNMQQALGYPITLEQAYQYIQDRDTRDSSRVLAPLMIPLDAIVIDSSLLNQDEVVQAVMGYIK